MNDRLLEIYFSSGFGVNLWSLAFGFQIGAFYIQHQTPAIMFVS